MIKHKLFLFALILIYFVLPISAQQTKQAPTVSGKQALLNYIETLKKDDDFKMASWGIKVVDCSSKNTIVSYQSEKNFVPASILKLVTTGIGLLTFKSNHTFTTTFAYSGNIDTDSTLQGNLYIIGGGDPTFGSTQFQKSSTDSIFKHLVKSLNASGIKHINGKLIADISLFDDAEIHNTWEWGDIGNYYGTGTSALSFCENMFSITIKPGDSVKNLAILGSPTPALPKANIKNKLSTSPKNTAVDALIYSSPMFSEYQISGTIPIGKDSVVAKGAIQNPAMVCIQNIDIFLNNNGISTIHEFEIKTDTSSIVITDTIAQWQSPAYSLIVENTNRHSNNMFAETILKNLAVYNLKSHQVSYNQGTDAIINILENKGVDTKNIQIADGSGLSRQNMVSADFMCQFLLMMNGAYPGFDKLMPAPGEKGTLTGFMSGYQKNRNKVRMKSGSMTGVLNYAGYVKSKKGNTLCICIMTNNFTCKVSKIRPKLEKLVYLITECE